MAEAGAPAVDPGPPPAGRAGATYAEAGVDIGAGDRAVDLIRDDIRSTFRPEVLGDIGGFGGLFAFAKDRYREPVLVGSTDGVGTKALVAKALGEFTTIGIDLVAMCVDDLACSGAEPLFFLDYIAVGRLDPDHVKQLVAGVAAGCRQANCAIIGGEMAAHPGAMEPGDFDLVGTAVGVVERSRIITGERLQPGDELIGLPSPGLRSNGYSLARKVLLERAGRKLSDPAWHGAGHSLGTELLVPSVIYAPAIGALLGAVDVRAVAHITGGGLPGNLVRVLPADLDAVVRLDSWEHPPIFGEIQRAGDVADAEMARVFNLGVGMVVAVPAGKDLYTALDLLRDKGHRAVRIGMITPGERRVHLEGHPR
ncbi:MAG TPA: phosphoribosylformylglycinamidine cyclo-ligase [Acidimicrobiales bacterium]|nr:phosphoribosylformylglycinamidine cyclo-ligase [Acidimicrobiales bacterium]